jgi:hypothetical protein
VRFQMKQLMLQKLIQFHPHLCKSEHFQMGMRRIHMCMQGDQNGQNKVLPTYLLSADTVRLTPFNLYNFLAVNNVRCQRIVTPLWAYFKREVVYFIEAFHFYIFEKAPISMVSARDARFFLICRYMQVTYKNRKMCTEMNTKYTKWS